MILPRTLDLLPFDRAIGAGKEAVLYADPTSRHFAAFHRSLSEAATKREVRYRIRYRKEHHTAANDLHVSGYGVELALKRTDYIVIDDREAVDDSQKPLSAEFALDNGEEVADLKPLSTAELSELGLKVASFIMRSDAPFDSLIKLTQDIPKFSASMAAQEVSEDFLAEHKQNRKLGFPPGVNYLWMNGVQLIERQIEPFSLIDMVRRERRFLQGVRDLGLSGRQAVSLLGHDRVATAKANKAPPRLDWTDRQEDGRVIVWLNDLEKDEQYAQYPTSVESVRSTLLCLLVEISLTIFASALATAKDLSRSTPANWEEHLPPRLAC